MFKQERLVNQINSYDELPHSLLLVGKSGCGKHTLVSYISNKFNLELSDITNNITYDNLTDIVINPNKSLCLINVDDITIKEQNMILKFVEEPTSNLYIILISENESSIIETLLNRCLVLKFDEYTKQDLNDYIKQYNLNNVTSQDLDYVIDICDTPGQIHNINSSILKPMLELCEKMYSMLNKASYMNTLKIAKKMNYSDSYDNYDVNLFLKTLAKTYASHSSIEQYNIVNSTITKLSNGRFNKEMLITKMLSELWLNCHSI